MKSIFICIVVCCISAGATSWLPAQEGKPASRFSHRGVKGTLAFGEFKNEFGQTLEEGEAGALSLGYGFDDHFTLWLSALGAEHPQIEEPAQAATDFGGIEINLQYKFFSRSAVQPYCKIGVGVYNLSEAGSNVTFIGGGFAFALGADYFFSRHFGIGAELLFRELDYSEKRTKTPAGDLTTHLDPQLDGKTRGFLIGIIVQ